MCSSKFWIDFDPRERARRAGKKSRTARSRPKTALHPGISKKCADSNKRKKPLLRQQLESIARQAQVLPPCSGLAHLLHSVTPPMNTCTPPYPPSEKGRSANSMTKARANPALAGDPGRTRRGACIFTNAPTPRACFVLLNPSERHGPQRHSPLPGSHPAFLGTLCGKRAAA